MPYGNVVGFILDPKEFELVAGFTFEEDNYEFANAVGDHYQKALYDAHTAACADYFNTTAQQGKLGFPGTNIQRQVTAITLEDKQICLTPFRIELMDDEHTQLMMLTLSARYFPMYLDWQSEHGTMYPAITFNEEMNKMIDIARKHIFKYAPDINQGPVSVFMNWY